MLPDNDFLAQARINKLVRALKQGPATILQLIDRRMMGQTEFNILRTRADVLELMRRGFVEDLGDGTLYRFVSLETHHVSLETRSQADES